MDDSELTLLSAVWRYRWMVLLAAVAVVALGVVYYLLRPQEEVFVASTTAVIQEPLATADEIAPQSSSSEFVGSQLEIMQSPVVSEAAAEIMTEDGVPMTSEDVAEAVTIVGDPDSPLVAIEAEASSPELAIGLSNALAEAYRDVTQRQARAVRDAQLERIDAQIEAINTRLAEIEEELAELAADNQALESLREAARQAVEEVAEVQAELLEAEGEEAAALRQRLDDLRQVRETYTEIATSTGSPEEQALVEEQTGQIDRRARLLIRRDEIAVDASLAPDAAALVQPATDARQLSGVGLSRLLAVTLILGLAVGVGLAYALSIWRRTFTNRSEPQTVLKAPLLADVPNFREEGISSHLPVRDNPRSAAAEAFRFAAATTEAAAKGAGVRSIFMASATIGHGKSTTAVNMAIAAAFGGRSVVVVDADFGSQEASRLLSGDSHFELRGITDVIEGVVSIKEGLHRVTLGNDAYVSLMPRGTRPTVAGAALQSDAAQKMFSALVASHDLVIVDGPPLLQVAYAAILADLAQGIVVVIEHDSGYSELSDLRGRLDLMDTKVLGYIYNRSPLRREMTQSEGSMMDILGDNFLRGEMTTQSRRG